MALMFLISIILMADTHWSGERCGDPNQGCAGYFLFEPSTTADGKLLVVNMMGSMAYSYNTTGGLQGGRMENIGPLSA